MTALQVASEARARVDRIKTGVEVIWQLVVESYQERDWEALGYATWDEMCTREFGTSRLRLPREERSDTVQSLRDAGLSLRAIAAVTGNSKQTVIEDLREKVVQIGPPEPVTYEPSGMDEFVVNRETGEVHDEPESWGASIDAEVEASDSSYVEPTPPPKPITGLDGKTYTAPAPRKPPRKPLIDVAKARGFSLRQAMDGVLNIAKDDRYAANEKQVADVLRGHLLYVAETVAAVLDQLP